MTYNRKEFKKKALSSLKKHYAIFVITCLLAAFVGASYTSSMTAIQSGEMNVTVEKEDVKNFDTVMLKLLRGELKESENEANAITEENQKKVDHFLGVSIGYRRGVFAGIANKLSNGSFFIIIYKTIQSVLGEGNIGVKIAVVVAGLLTTCASFLVVGLIEVAYRRIFLEGYIYKEVTITRFMYLIRIKKWFKAAFASLLKSILLTLWSLTLIGPAIKYYCWVLSEYIVAENPDIGAYEALKLSQRMMKGHKFEYFKAELSYVGWFFLNIFTYGISGILFSNPYMEGFLCEYYVYLRTLAIENKIEGYEYFNDKFLYETADNETLVNTYPDYYQYKDQNVEVPKLYGFKGFMADNFGLIIDEDTLDPNYIEARTKKNNFEEYKNIFDLERYPERLSPLPVDVKNKQFGIENYDRLYSIWNVVLMFFIFAFVGWAWEVSLHLVKDGVFVNRGVLHGPWLPIYGAGGVLILLVLYRFRKNPPLEFFSAVVLCGVVEYFTHYYLEITKGTKWWDYTGYFLNINGRICAEGLLIFGLGGVAFVYFCAPILDNYIRKIKKPVLITIALLLSLVFVSDQIYSSSHPNTGEGITDYEAIEGKYIC